MKAVRSDEDIVNEQVDGFKIKILPKSVGYTVEQAIEYRKQNVWDTSDGSVDVDDLPYKDELNAIADDLHENNRKVAVLVDVDVDGFTSSAIIYKALKEINSDLDIDVLLPNAKLHGIKANIDLVNKDYNYLFLPDSSSNDLYTIAQLEKKGTKCVVIDHHTIEQESYLLDNPDKFLICSNQFQDGQLNRNLTGAGMTLLVTKLWKQKHDNIELNYDLAALGEIADMSDLNDKDIYEVVKQGLSNMNNKMIVEFFKDDPEILSVKHLQFSLIPRINSVSRIGEHGDRKLIFDALIDRDESEPVNIRHKGQDGKFHTESVQMNVYERAKRMLNKVKGQQDRLVKKALKDVEWLDGGDNFNAVVLDKKFDKGIAGLVANKLLGQTKQPTLTLKHNGNRLDGSARFPQTINGLELLGNIDGVFSAGHEQAFGCSFSENKFGKIAEAIETASKNAPDYVYRVDEALVNELPSVKEIREIYQASKIFRGAKDEIQIAVLGLEVAKKDIRLKNNWLQLKIDDITIDNFNTTSELKRYVESGFGDKCFSFVCSASMNFWGREVTPQLIVDTMTISDGVTVPTTKENFIF